MTLRDYVLLGSSLIMGILTGLYLYFTTFIPEYVANPDLTQVLEERRDDVQITGEQYGGCAMTRQCASFSLTNDRSYRYDAGIVRNASATFENGTVPRGLYHDVVDAVKEADLSALGAPAQKQCINWVDGIDYRYVIVVEGEVFTLDSCTTYFDADSELGRWLYELFLYMDNPTVYEAPDDGSRGGLGGIIEEKLEETFDTTH